ncbi:MAG: spore maturation protein [Dysgonamonadaceae bacterium]|jgi:spore maturation protein SpmA|nr:spore maturation protein [Dysgonamonadaceae bacterium]
MALNYIWIAFFLIAFAAAIFKLLLTGDVNVFPNMMNAAFDAAKNGFEISIGLTGVLALWLGFMKIGEKGGAVNALARWAAPIFSKLFPDVPKKHPATGSIFMNIAANMLNLDNAATPAGLKAMRELQEINPNKTSASNPMIMFIVLNASGLTVIPISIMVYRTQMNAANPADVFLPLMLSTLVATLAGMLFVAIRQKINLLDPVLIKLICGIIAFVATIILLVRKFPDETTLYSPIIANVFLFSTLITFIIAGVRKKINVYNAFIEGAKDGFKTAVMIIPYLIAILAGVAVFRASGAMGMLIEGLTELVSLCRLPSEWVEAFPVALMKPLSGSGARGLMIEAMQTYGADSFTGRLASLFQGSTDTTFYLVAVYYGSVNIRNSRYTVPGALLADLAGIITAVFVCYLFYGTT